MAFASTSRRALMRSVAGLSIGESALGAARRMIGESALGAARRMNQSIALTRAAQQTAITRPLPASRVLTSARAYSSAPKQDAEQSSSSSGAKEEDADADPDEPPPKASIRERLRFLTRRYGWWALGVYLLASSLDFSLTFLAIHMMGADHIRELENRVRQYLGMGSREMEDAEVAAWPVPVSVGYPGNTADGALKNNEEAAKKAVQRVHSQKDVNVQAAKSPAKKSGGSTIWTEVVLAYTIHKTLLLPFRVGVTAAITPSFVKYMVRMGWARNNAAVQQAAKQAQLARQARKSTTTAATKKE